MGAQVGDFVNGCSGVAGAQQPGAAHAAARSCGGGVGGAGAIVPYGGCQQVVAYNPVVTPMAVNSMTTGIVKTYNSQNGYGFLVADGVEGDIYFKPPEPVQVGQRLRFNLRQTPDGKARASNIVIGFVSGETTDVTVKSYRADKGWGFLVADGMSQDIYFKTQNLPEDLQSSGTELIGKRLRASLKLMPDGKPRVMSIQSLNDAVVWAMPVGGTAAWQPGAAGWAAAPAAPAGQVWYAVPAAGAAWYASADGWGQAMSTGASEPPAKRQCVDAGISWQAAQAYGEGTDGWAGA